MIMNMMKLLVVPCALAVVSLATAEEQQIEVSAEASGRLYANYTHGDCCTLDALDWGPSTIWTDTCETMGGYCMAGRDVANWTFQIPELPDGAELLEVRLKVYRQSGSSGSSTLKMRGVGHGSLSTSSALLTYTNPSHSQSAYFSGSVTHAFSLPLSHFEDPNMDPYLAIGIYRSSYLSMFNSGTYAPKLEFTFDVETGPPCDGDINDDDVVDGSDLSQVLGVWGSSSELHDLDGNGVVDGADLTIILGEWGACPE